MKLLMHICCGPCAMYPAEVIKQKDIEYEGYFYNPNIHPLEEFERRIEAAKKWSEIYNIKLNILREYDEKPWQRLKDEKEKRCDMCYSRRIKETCRYAKENRFTHVTSTLFVSPYQKHELMKDKFEKYADEYGVKFLYFDFREGFRKGNSMAKKQGLYTQRYCGCGPSYYESDIILKKLRKS